MATLKYGALINYKLSKHFDINSRLLMSFKIPNQKKIQQQAQSQINPQAGGTQNITMEISMHAIIELATQLNYTFNLHKEWQTFAGLGLAVTSFTSAHKKWLSQLIFPHLVELVMTGWVV